MTALNSPAARMAATHLGSPVVAVTWTSAHLSVVQALELADGRRVVAKTRAYHPRLQTCVAIHRHVWRHGYHCSEPLTDALTQDGTAVTFESYLEDRPALDVGPPDSAASAQALAALVTIASGAGVMAGSLDPPVPWMWWDHDQEGLWPLPDDLTIDLNDIVGPEVIDRAAHRLRERLARYRPSTTVIGHGDWEAQNVFWRAGVLHAVHDWDSLVERPEPFIAGPAAAVHGVRWGRSGRPTPDAMRTFIDAYTAARNLSWTIQDKQACLAAGLWVHLFNAKKAATANRPTAIDDPYLKQMIDLIDTVED